MRRKRNREANGTRTDGEENESNNLVSLHTQLNKRTSCRRSSPRIRPIAASHRGEQRTRVLSLECTAVRFNQRNWRDTVVAHMILRSCFRLQSRLLFLLLPQSHRNITLLYFSRVFASKYYILPVWSECKRQCTRKSRKKETTNTRCGVCSGTSDKNNNKRRVV